METLGEKKGYARAMAILKHDHEIRKAINPQDPCLMGLLLAMNCLWLYNDQPYPGEKKWRVNP